MSALRAELMRRLDDEADAALARTKRTIQSVFAPGEPMVSKDSAKEPNKTAMPRGDATMPLSPNLAEGGPKKKPSVAAGHRSSIDGGNIFNRYPQRRVDPVKLRVRPEDVEKALESHPNVEEAAVVAVPHPTTGQHIYAFVVAGDSPPANLRDSLMKHVNQEAGLIALPYKIHFADALPRSPDGRILRGLLTRIATGEGFEMAVTEAQRAYLQRLISLRP
jgi:hypothetical protein